jgi:hypothetical protein
MSCRDVMLVWLTPPFPIARPFPLRLLDGSWRLANIIAAPKRPSAPLNAAFSCNCSLPCRKPSQYVCAVLAAEKQGLNADLRFSPLSRLSRFPRRLRFLWLPRWLVYARHARSIKTTACWPLNACESLPITPGNRRRLLPTRDSKTCAFRQHSHVIERLCKDTLPVKFQIHPFFLPPGMCLD